MKTKLSFLNASNLANTYGEQHKEYFTIFCSKSLEFMKSQQITQPIEFESIDEMVIDPQNLSPTAFILDYMSGSNMNLMVEYLDMVFDFEIPPLIAATYLHDKFPQVSPAITSIAGSVASAVSFIASDIIAARYILFRHPLVLEPVDINAGGKAMDYKDMDFAVRTSDTRLSIASVRKYGDGSLSRDFFQSSELQFNEDSAFILESTNLKLVEGHKGASNLHFVVLLDRFGEPTSDVPDNEQIWNVIKACKGIGTKSITRTGKRDATIEKMLRAKNKKPHMKKLLKLQDTYK